MGAGASLLQEDKNKPANASDITSLEMGVLEIRRLRLLAQQNPGTEFDIEAAKPADASDITTHAKAQLEIARLRTLFRIKVPSLDRVKIAGELHWEESEMARAAKECQEVLLQSHALLQEINPVQLGQLAATAVPTPEFALCLQAVLTLLKQFHKPYRKVAKWQTALLLLKNMQFVTMLLQYPVKRVSATTIGKLQKFLKDEQLCEYAELKELASPAQHRPPNQNTSSSRNNSSNSGTNQRTSPQRRASGKQGNSAGANAGLQGLPENVHRFAAARLMAWCRAVNHHATTLFPRAAKVKALRQAIDDLKSPEEKVAERFTQYRQKGLQKLYRSLDKDSNGAVSFVEVQTFLARYNCLKTKQKEWKEKINVAHDQARRIVGRGDVEGGYVCAAELEFDEFVAFMLTLLKVIFNKVDLNGDGVIASEEMQALLKIMYGPGMGMGTPAAGQKKEASKKVEKKAKAMFKMMMAAAQGKANLTTSTSTSAPQPSSAKTSSSTGRGAGKAGGKTQAGGKGAAWEPPAAKGGPEQGGRQQQQDGDGGGDDEQLEHVEGAGQDVFIDFMIDVLVLPANIKKRVLERLLTLSVSDADWDGAKKAATLEYVQVAMASEVQVSAKATASK